MPDWGMRMNRVVLTLLLFCGMAFAKTHIAILETTLDGPKDPLSLADRQHITSKLVEMAKKEFNDSNFVIMDSENIREFLPPDKITVACEGECLAKIGREISAEYVFQARMSQFADGLISLRGELRSSMDVFERRFSIDGKDRQEITQKAVAETRKLLLDLLLWLDPLYGTGINDVSMGVGAQEKGLMLDVSSEPLAAGFSVDGATLPDCDKTPCSLELMKDKHSFRFHAPWYMDLDTSIYLDEKISRLHVKLKPNFGVLDLNPQIIEGVGRDEDFEAEVDGKKQNVGRINLMPGSHRVKVMNRCYETANFRVNIDRDVQVTFDSTMKPLMGRLKVEAKKNGKPVRIPVFGPGIRPESMTPFNEMVPVCTKVMVGRDSTVADVELKVGETATYVHNYSGSFALLEKEFLDKRDGKEYPVVTIAGQEWMVKNLDFVEKKKSWCYKGKDSNCRKYGRLYTWEAASRACPAGWKLPSVADYKELFAHVGEKHYVGVVLKSDSGWISDGNGNNDFYFSVLPSGYRNQNGIYFNVGEKAFFWTSDSVDARRSSVVFDYNSDRALVSEDYGDAAFAVRCIRDPNYVDVDTLCENLTWRESSWWNSRERSCLEAQGSVKEDCQSRKAKCLKDAYFPRFWREFLVQSHCRVSKWNQGCLEYSVIESVTANKTLPVQAGNRYDATNVLDGGPTAWAAPYSNKSKLRLDVKVKPGATVYGIAIRNGYRKDAESYANNSRIRKAKISIDSKPFKTVEFEDMETDFDMVDFETPLQGVKTVSIEILDVYRGNKYNDVCVTSLSLVGTLD